MTARESKDENFYKVTACIDPSNINLVDKSGKSVVPPRGPRRVSYDYTVEKDQQKWYVIEEKVDENLLRVRGLLFSFWCWRGT